jgi:ABC-2 type transport system permease protein
VIAMTREARAGYAFVERNFNLTKRYWGWEVAFLVYAVAGALSVSLIGSRSAAAGCSCPSLSAPSSGTTSRWSSSRSATRSPGSAGKGTLEYTMMAPVRRSVQLLGSALYAVIYGLIHTILLIVLALFFSLDLGHANLGAAALFMIVGSPASSASACWPRSCR